MEALLPSTLSAPWPVSSESRKSSEQKGRSDLQKVSVKKREKAESPMRPRLEKSISGARDEKSSVYALSQRTPKPAQPAAA